MDIDKDTRVKLYNAAHTDKNDMITEIFKSKALLVGSATVNKGIMHGSGGLLDMIRGIGFKNKKAAAFGTYGWSGESVGILEEKLSNAKFEIVQDGLKALWMPDEEAQEACIEFGENFAKVL